MRDPSGNLIIFAEHIPEADASIKRGVLDLVFRLT